MSEAENHNIGTTSVRETHRFDEGRLAEWMAINVDGYRGPLSIEQFKGGHYAVVLNGR